MVADDVAPCSQAGVDYTEGPGDIPVEGVAACSQAGVDYTAAPANAAEQATWR